MMMFGFILLMMLLVVGLPVLLIALILGGGSGLLRNHTQSMSSPQNQPSITHQNISTIPTASMPARYCSHCGAGLQPDWAYCVQCGAPV